MLPRLTRPATKSQGFLRNRQGDMVFSDGAQLETPTITGGVTDGYTIAMTAAIAR